MHKRFYMEIDELYKPLSLDRYNGESYDGKDITSEIQSFFKSITYDKKINVNNVMEEWFPKVKADIFLSHSHKDKKKVIQFANYLYNNFGLTAFIDSEVWKYMNDLLNTLNKTYCMDEETNLYWYSKTLYTSENIHTILTASLMKMIDETECIMFLNSNNTTIQISQNTETNSPWIYIELVINNIIREKELERPTLSTYVTEGGLIKAAEMESLSLPVFSFDVTPPLSFFIPLSGNDFSQWYVKFYLNKTNIRIPAMALDILYKLKG